MKASTANWRINDPVSLTMKAVSLPASRKITLNLPSANEILLNRRGQAVPLGSAFRSKRDYNRKPKHFSGWE